MTTKLELKDNECAIIFGDNGPEIYIPRLEEDESISLDILTVCAIAHAIKNESKHLIEIVDEFQREMKIKDMGSKPVSASSSLTKSVAGW